MGDKSKISWTDATWNPVVGCSPVSPGCANCYAAEVAASLERRGVVQYLGTTKTLSGSGPVRHAWTGKINPVEHALRLPLRWKSPRKIFVNSMSDLFHERLSFEEIDRIFAVMALCPQHTFQVLTKRADRMAIYWEYPSLRMALILNQAAELRGSAYSPEEFLAIASRPLPNVWLGVSVEDQERADERIPWLLDTPAAVRFLSCEPLLGAIDLKPRPNGNRELCVYCGGGPNDPHADHSYRTRGLDWVIVGGESGNRFLECDVEWINSIARQCQAAGVPVWVKQDCGRKPEQQGRIPVEVWNLKQMPGDVKV